MSEVLPTSDGRLETRLQSPPTLLSSGYLPNNSFALDGLQSPRVAEYPPVPLSQLYPLSTQVLQSNVVPIAINILQQGDNT